MATFKYSDRQIERIREFLERGGSARVISKALKEEGISISYETVNKYRNQWNLTTPHGRGRLGAIPNYSLTEFSKYYFPHDMPLEGAAFHNEMRDLLVTKTRLVIAAPRSFAKSTIVAKHFPLWKALFWRKRGERVPPYIIIVSATGALAEDRIEKIRWEVENNRAIEHDFGDQRSPLWRQNKLVFRNGAVIEAKGQGYQTRGPRPEVVIVDDIEEDEGVAIEGRRRKLKDWFWKALFNVLEPEGQLAVIGTLIHPLSLLTEIIQKPPPEFTVKKYAAIDYQGNPTWPAKWTMEQLELRRRQIGDERFSAEFMNDPLVSTDTPIVRRLWLTESLSDDQPGLADYGRIVLAVDPAVGRSHESDESGLAVIGKITSQSHPHFDECFVLSARKGKWSIYGLVNEIVADIQRFDLPKRNAVLVIETVFWQETIAHVLVKEMDKIGIRVPVKEIKPRADKVTRLKGVTPFLERRMVHLRESQRDLFDQLVSFPHGRKDLADAFVHAVTELYSEGSASITGGEPSSPKEKPLFPDLDIKSWVGKPKAKVWYNF